MTLEFEVSSVHRKFLPGGLQINKSFSPPPPPPQKKIIIRYLAIVRLPFANISKGSSHLSKIKEELLDRKVVSKGIATFSDGNQVPREIYHSSSCLY